jgi:hypothetical protein
LVSPVHNPHDEHLRLGWRLCRFGAAEIEDAAKQRRVIEWLGRMEHVVPGSPHLREWARIVSQQAPELALELSSVRDFFELPKDRQGIWRPLVQSQPFSCLLPGRTTRDRRAVLSRLP